MLRPCLLAVLIAAASSGAAHAAPSRGQRVVLADPDPELRRAIELALAPYHLEVVIEGPAPADDGMAQQRADADVARFVVWRDGERLVLYDRELGTTERRDTRSGVLDPPTAAAAALTVKTMMRLPPPPAPPEAPLSPAPAPSVEFRLQAGLASRIARSTDTAISTRFSGVAAIRPWSTAGWRAGVVADGGAAIDIDRASFKGTFADWAVLGVIGWTYEGGGWELEPHVGFGVRHSMLDGLEMMTSRSETATLATAREGVCARLRWSRLTVGVTVDTDEVFGTPTYTKTNSPAEVFQVPGIAVEVGAVVAVDL